jgi:hypothetical protein
MAKVSISTLILPLEDKLVLWAWNPGEGRSPVPMPHEEFAAKVKQWQAAGAPCPAEVK